MTRPDGVTVHLTDEDVLLDLWTHAHAAYEQMNRGNNYIAGLHYGRHRKLLRAYQDTLAGDDTPP